MLVNMLRMILLVNRFIPCYLLNLAVKVAKGTQNMEFPSTKNVFQYNILQLIIKNVGFQCPCHVGEYRFLEKARLANFDVDVDVAVSVQSVEYKHCNIYEDNY